MQIRQLIILFFTIFFVSMSVYILFDMVTQIPKSQNLEVDDILTSLIEQLNRKEPDQRQLKEYKKGLFFVIWLHADDSEWIPLVYDQNYFSPDHTNPANIPDNIRTMVRSYSKTIHKHDFIVWINQLELFYIIKNLIIPLLMLMAIYLIIIFIINILFYAPRKIIEHDESPISTQFNTVSESFEPMNADLTREEVDALLRADEPENELKTDIRIGENAHSVLDDYRDLWQRNFKITDHFKNNFLFSEIFSLLQFGTKPETYLKKAMEYANYYFPWKEASFFILQGKDFVQFDTHQVQEESSMTIPVTGDQKGELYLPLFPYGIRNVFGYFYFNWDSPDNFFLSDLIFFLKYLFSEDAKPIFLQYKDHSAAIEAMGRSMKNNAAFFTAVICPDNREKLKADLSIAEKEDLDRQIFLKLEKHLKKYHPFKIYPFYYGIYGDHEEKEKLVRHLEEVFSDTDFNTYLKSMQENALSLSFSAGLAFSSKRTIEPVTLVHEAEAFLKVARSQGGNQVVSG